MSREKIANHLELASRFDEVARAERAVIGVLQEYGYDETDVFAIKLALEEALTNAIKHGNNLNPNKQVQFEYEVNTEQVTLKVCDEGPGFCPDEVPDCTADENIERPSGRGVMLMNAYMTEVSYNDKGNCVTMIRRRDP